jgi:hypothetical protein
MSSERWTAALVALAIGLVGVALGASMTTAIAVTESTPTVTRTVTTTVTVPPRPTPRADRDRPRHALSAREYAGSLLSPRQYRCLDRLYTRESGWNPKAVGPLNTDGRYPIGIPQLKGLKTTDAPAYQVKRGLAYIEHRHGSPCAAWSFFQQNGWH